MYTYQDHSFEKRKYMPWYVCKHCGVVLLNNPITEWIVKHGCNSVDHPEFKAVLKKLTARPNTASYKR